MQPKRRAFLFGRSSVRSEPAGRPEPVSRETRAAEPAAAQAAQPALPAQAAWPDFCQRLRRVCQGPLDEGPELDGIGYGLLTPLSADDVRQARTLCAEHGVALALAGPAGAEGMRTAPALRRSVLRVDPARLTRMDSFARRVNRWRAEPGVPLGELVRAGLPQFAQAPPDMTLGAWLADRRHAAWPVGRGDLSGIHSIDVLLSDGSAETLGPFGASDTRPLAAGTLQRLVSALFQLSSTPDGQWARGQPRWPARYRLDALMPTPPADVNLAHLLPGSGGTLAWVENVMLQAAPGVPDVPGADPAGTDEPGAQLLDARMKALFDPLDMYAGLHAK